MHDEDPRTSKLFLIGMILSMTCWGFSWSSGKILSSYGDPLTISFLRFALTFLSLVFILPVVKAEFAIRMAGLKYLILASLMISLYTFLFFRGLVTGKAGAGGVLVTVLNPIISYAIMLTLSRRRPTRNESVGLMLALVAGVVLLRLTTNANEIFNAGNIYFLFASMSWAILSVFTSKASRYGAPLAFSFYMYGVSTVLMFCFAGIHGIQATVAKSDWTFWLNLFFSATITTSMATTFYFVATARIGASKASSFIFLVPFSAAIGSWIFLHEVPLPHTVIGGVLGILAVYVLNKKVKSLA